MYSGGIDSTGMLYKLFTDEKYNEYEFHIHFIKIINREKRYEAEANATKLCLEWFKNNNKNFLYSENIIDFLFLKNGFPWDIDIYNFVIAEIIIASNNLYKYIAIGRTASDLSTTGESNRVLNSNKILTTILSNYNKTFEKIFPVEDLTKKQIWDIMPIDLRKNTWSCRTPKYENNGYIPCGNCKTCMEMKKNKIGYFEKI